MSLRGKRDITATKLANFSDNRSFISLAGKLFLYGKQDWEYQREAVLMRDRGRCQACGCLPDPPEIDHIVPRGKGGSDDLENLRVLCGPCHRAKHFQVQLRTIPFEASEGRAGE